MPLSMAAKAALCICPPAVMAGTVATVPAAKRAVHHMTAPKAPPRAIKSASLDAPAARPATTQQPVDCDPNAPVAIPAVPLVTYAAPVPDEPSGSGFGPGFVSTGASVGAIGVVGGGGGGGTTPGNPGGGGVVPGPIPEPSIWLMMITGVGTLGALMRRRRRAAAAAAADARAHGRKARNAAAGLGLWSGSAAVEAGDVAATVAVKSAVASAAGKALLCVCPAAVVAGSVVAVPPLRQAVHAATKVPEVAPLVPVSTMGSGIACVDPTTVPVSGESLAGFPASVKTAAADLSGAPASVIPAAMTKPAILPIADRSGWMADTSTVAANPLS